MSEYTNLPILYQNVIFGLRSRAGIEAFLWATERPGMDRMVYAAEAFAHEVEQLHLVLWVLLKAGLRVHDCQSLAVLMDLHTFILRRHAFWRFPTAKEAWI